ncbi:Histidine kinase [Gammaproteobacteria bacterium]
MANYSERYRQLLLMLIMMMVGLTIGGVTLTILYQTSLEQTRQRLLEMVQSHARLIETMARHDSDYTNNLNNSELRQRFLEKILDGLREVNHEFQGLGETGEFVLGRRSGNQIVFFLRRRHDKTDIPFLIQYNSSYAAPMRQAVDGKSGLIIGLDYRGVMVMAAHEPIKLLNVGIVAKIDLEELRRPFIFAAGIAFGIGAVVILVGGLFFFRISEPWLHQVQETILLRENRKRLEEAQANLQEKAIYLDNILSSTSDIAIIATDLELIIKYFNSTAEVFFDLSASMVIGKTVRDIHLQRGVDPVRLEQSISSVLTDGEYRYEIKNIFKGRELILESRILSMLDQNKKPVGFLLVAQDVTANRRAQAALIQSERKYRLLVESASDAIFLADADTGIILEANRMAEKLLQRNLSEIVGLHQTMLHPPEDAEYYSRIFHEQIQYQSETLEDMMIIRSDGCRVPIEIRATVTNLGNKRVILGIFRDVTERKNIENSLRISQQKLAKAQMIAHLGNWDLDLRTDYMEWSDEAYRILGREPQSEIVTFDTFLKILSPQDRPVVEMAIKNALTDPYPPYEVDHRIIRPDGKEIYVHQQGMLILDKEKTPERFIGTIQDVTVYKTMENVLQGMNQELENRVAQRTRELERSNLDLQQFAYAASHDLKEPLRLVAGFVQLLEKRYSKLLDEKGSQYIAYVVDGVKHMDSLIDSLLAYARVERFGESMAHVSAESALDRALRYLGRAITEAMATVTRDPLPTITADEGQLVQIFQNLLGNAIKFRADHPLIIHISCRSVDEEWIFSVQDNGIGIDAQYAERIFVIFQKLHARSLYDGTGIGLALCKRIVERHGGHIWVESKLGLGSTFFFTVPK